MGDGRLLVQATVTSIGDDHFLYPCCSHCYSKLLHDLKKDRWCCFKCGESLSYEEMSWRYRLRLTVADTQQYQQVAIFGRTLQPYFGLSANAFHRYLCYLRTVIPHLTESVLEEAVSNVFVGQSFLFGFSTAARTRVSSSISTLSCVQRQTETNPDLVAVQMLCHDPSQIVTVTQHISYLAKKFTTPDSILDNNSLVNTSDVRTSPPSNQMSDSAQSLHSLCYNSGNMVSLMSLILSCENSLAEVSTSSKILNHASLLSDKNLEKSTCSSIENIRMGTFCGEDVSNLPENSSLVLEDYINSIQSKHKLNSSPQTFLHSLPIVEKHEKHTASIGIEAKDPCILQAMWDEMPYSEDLDDFLVKAGEVVGIPTVDLAVPEKCSVVEDVIQEDTGKVIQSVSTTTAERGTSLTGISETSPLQDVFCQSACAASEALHSTSTKTDYSAVTLLHGSPNSEMELLIQRNTSGLDGNNQVLWEDLPDSEDLDEFLAKAAADMSPPPAPSDHLNNTNVNIKTLTPSKNNDFRVSLSEESVYSPNQKLNKVLSVKCSELQNSISSSPRHISVHAGYQEVFDNYLDGSAELFDGSCDLFETTETADELRKESSLLSSQENKSLSTSVEVQDSQSQSNISKESFASVSTSCRKQVKFARRLSHISSIQLIDIRMKLAFGTPVQSQGTPVKSCLKLASKSAFVSYDNQAGRGGTALVSVHSSSQNEEHLPKSKNDSFINMYPMSQDLFGQADDIDDSFSLVNTIENCDINPVHAMMSVDDTEIVPKNFESGMCYSDPNETVRSNNGTPVLFSQEDKDIFQSPLSSTPNSESLLEDVELDFTPELF